jgi:hypothetical protein
VAIDPAALETPGTPAWWMQNLAMRLLSRDRVKRLGILEAYRSGCPPMVTATESQRRAYHAFSKASRSNYARTIVRAPGERMLVRAIRTAAANDDDGDAVAWRYWTANGLDVASTDVHSDMLSFSEGYVRVGQREDGSPIALRRDPRFCIAVEDPLNPLRTLAAFELVWDEFTGYDYAFLWLPGEQWVAERKRAGRPPQVNIPGLSAADRRWAGLAYWPRLSFDAGSFTMRPNIDEVAEAERDGRPYSETHAVQEVPVVRFDNRDGVGEFEEHLDVLDRAYLLTMLLLVTAGVQAYKQRFLEQDLASTGQTIDRLPEKDPTTGEAIDWDEIFQPGPDALWKLPPGVTLREAGQVDMQGLSTAVKDTLKELSITTGTPFTILAPDGMNQSAAGAEGYLEPLIFKVKDRDKIAARKWGQVLSLLFQFAPDGDRYQGGDPTGADRADAGGIVIDWEPPVRYSILEMAQADSANKSLSADMAAQKFYGLTPDEVAINRAQRAADVLLNPAPAPAVPNGATAAG